MLRSLHAVSSLLLGIGLVLMGLSLLGTSLGVRAVGEGFRDTVIGFVMASYFAGFVIGSYLCPAMITRIGPIRSYAALAAIGSACAFAHALFVDPVVWAILRCIMGICLVGLYMVVESWLNSITPNDRRGRVFSVYMIVTLAAHALGQFLLLLDPMAEVTAFGIAAVFFSLGLVPVALTRLPQPEPVAVPTNLHLGQLMRSAPLSLAGALTGGLTTSSFWAMGAVFAQRSGLAGGELVTFMVVTIAGGVVLQWPIGRLSDSIDRRGVLAGTSALAAVAALLAALTHGLGTGWLYTCAFLVGGLIFPIYALSVAHLNDRIDSSEALEASRGILLVYGVGAFLGPLFTGLVMSMTGAGGLFHYLVLVLAGFVLVAVFHIRMSPPLPQAERSVFLPVTRTSQAALELDPRLGQAPEHAPDGVEKGQ